jgi:hypothetical protein
VTPAELRDLFGDESLIVKMTSSAPPLVSQVSEHNRPDGGVYYEVILEEEPADRIGQSLSGQMVSLIGGVTVDLATYSPRWPLRRALQEWERSCRRRHRPLPSSQWRDHVNGPLCSDLLRAASIGVSLQWCAETWGIPYPRAERLREAGLRFVAERIARWEGDQLGIVHDREACEVCQEEQGA